jgi:GDP-L-fucose synthase
MMASRVFVAGHLGMVGSAIVRQLIKNGYPANSIITRTRQELDLLNQAAVHRFFQEEQPDQVYVAAAKVGGINANNTYPAEFIYENLVLQTNIIEAAFRAGVRKLLFLGSSCIYPKHATQPITEESLLTGALEPTNEPYAIGKIAGIKLCESYNRQYGLSHGVDYRSLMPTNLYGPGDNYHPENSHVAPALIRRFYEAKLTGAPMVKIWGSGSARREFLYVDDMASACCFVMETPKGTYEAQTAPMRSYLNVGSGQDIAILELAHLIAQTVGYHGEIVPDITKPEGPPQKLMDSSRLRSLGWNPRVPLAEGLSLAFSDFLQQYRT